MSPMPTWDRHGRRCNGREYARQVGRNDRSQRVVERRRREVAHPRCDAEGGARIRMDVVVNR